MTKQKRNHKRGSTLPGISEQPRLKPTALAVALAMLAMGSSQLYAAGPTGGAVVGGTGTITNPDANNTKIEQTSDRLAIEWASFNVSKDHTVQFAQPNSNAWVLNQINDTNPSLIEGNINANGRVILVNSNGLHFTSTAQVNVASLIASGHQLNTTDFMAKNSQLTANQTTGNGDVVNAGTIKAATGGTVTLLGKRIENTGKIFANAGQVNLAVGKTITLDFAGDNLLKFTITEALAENLETKSSAILNSNTGEINSESGSIIIEGKVASSVFDNVVNNQGLIRAKGISSSGGTIKLIGSGGSLSSVANTGELDASATSAGNNAGTVTLNAINSLLNLDDQSKIIVNSTDAKSGTINLLGNKINLSGNQIFTTGGAIDSKSDNLIIKATDSISQDTNAKINIITNQSGIILEAVNKITLDGGITTNNGNIKIETTAATSSILGKGDLSGNEVTLNSAGEIAVEGEIAGSKVLLEAKGSLGTSDTLRIKTKTNNLGVFSDDVAWISNTSTDETTLVANTTGSFNFINTGHNITIDKIKNSSGTEKKGITAEKVLMGLSAGLTLNEAINTTGTISIEATGTITTKASIKSSNNEINLKASTFELNLGEINSGTGGLKMEATSTANAATIINQDSGQGGIIANNLLLIISGTGTARNINLGSSSNSITRLAGNSSGTSGGGRNSAKLKLKNSKNLTIDKIGDVTGYQGEDVDIELIGLASKLEIKSNMDVHSLKVTGNFDLANNKELKASSLVITGTTNLAGDVTTTGTQTYTGATTLVGVRTLEGSTLTFKDTLTGDNSNLTLKGNTLFEGAVDNFADVSNQGNATFKGTATNLKAVSVTGNLDLQASMTAAALTVSGTSKLAGDVTTTATQTYTGATTLVGVRTLEGSTLTFKDTLTGDKSNLTLKGNTLFEGAVDSFADVSNQGNATFKGAATNLKGVSVTGNLDLQASMAGESLTVSGTSKLAGDVTTTATQTYTGATTLVGARTLEGSTLTFKDTLTGDKSNLTLKGTTFLEGMVSNLGALSITKSLDLKAALTADSLTVSGTSKLAGDVTTTATQTYTGATNLVGARTLEGSTLTFKDTLTGDKSNLTLKGATFLEGTVSNLGALSITKSLDLKAALTADSLTVSGTSKLAGDVTTTATQTYTGATNLVGVRTLEGSTLTFKDTLTGDKSNLTLKGNTLFEGAVDNFADVSNQGNATFKGAATNLKAVSVTGNLDLQASMTAAALTVSGTSKLAGDVTTTATQTYTGATTLVGVRTLEGSTLTFKDTLTGDKSNLTLKGNTLFEGAVDSFADVSNQGNATFKGAATNLKAVSVTGNLDLQASMAGESLSVSGTSKLAGDVTTTGTQTYTGATTLVGVRTLEGSTLTFKDTLTGDKSNLTLKGATFLEGTVSNLGALSITKSLDLKAALTADSLTVSGTSKLAGDVTTTATQTYTGATNLVGVRTLEGSTLTFKDTLTGDKSNLTLKGNTLFEGAVDNFADVSNQGNATYKGTATNLKAVSVTGNLDLQASMTAAALTVSGISKLAGDVTTTGTQTYTGATTLVGVRTLEGSTLTFKDTLTGDKSNLTLKGATFLEGTVSNLGALSITKSLDLKAALTADSLTVSETSKLAGDVTTTGTQTYTGETNLVGTRTLKGSALNFENTLTGNNADLTLEGSTNLKGAATNLKAVSVTGNLDLQASMTAAALTVSGISKLAGDVTTTGTQTYAGATTLFFGARTLEGSTLTFKDTLTGDKSNLTLKGNTLFEGVVDNFADISNQGNATFKGAATNLKAVSVTGNLDLQASMTAAALTVSGTSKLAGDVTTKGTQTYTGATTLVGVRTLEGSTLTFKDTLTGDKSNLTLKGNTLFEGAVDNFADISNQGNAAFKGAATNLKGVSVTGNLDLQASMAGESLTVSGTSKLAGDVTTTATQTYTGATNLVGARTLEGSTLTFKDTLTGDKSNLTLKGNTLFEGAVDSFADVSNQGNATYKGAATNLKAVSVTGNLDLQASMTAAALTVSGTSKLAGDVTTTGTQTYTGATTLVGVRTLKGSALNFENTLTGNNADLTLEGSTNLKGTATNLKAVSVTGNLDLQASMTAAALTVSGTSKLAGDVTTTATQTYTGAITLAGVRTLEGSTLTFKDTLTGDNSNLTLKGNTLFEGAVDNFADVSNQGNATFKGAATNLKGVSVIGNLDLQASMAGESLTVSGTSKLAGDVTTTATQTYTGATTLVNNRSLKGSELSFNSTLIGNSHNLVIEAVTGSINFNTSISSINDLTINKANNVNFNGSINLSGNLTQLTGIGNTHFTRDSFANVFNIKTQTITLDSGKKLSTEATNGDIKLYTDNLAISGLLDAGTGGITIAPLNINRELFVCSGICTTDANYDSSNPNHALYNIGGDFSYKASLFNIGSAGHTGNITLYQFNPSFDLSLTTTANINISGIFSSNYNLSLEGKSGINLSHNIITKGNQHYKGSLLIKDNDATTSMSGVELTSSNGSIIFDAAINSELDSISSLLTTKSFGLKLSAANEIIFNEDIGKDTTKSKLEYLEIISNSNIKINSDIHTKSKQSYAGQVTFTGNRQLESKNITTVKGIEGDTVDLKINGNWHHEGISNLSNSKLIVEGTTKISGNLTTSGQQKYRNTLNLIGNTQLTSTTDQLIFDEAITGSYALTLTSESKSFTQNKDISLGSLNIKASNINLKGQVTTLENQNYQGSLNLLDDTYLTAKDGSNLKLVTMNGNLTGNNHLLNLISNGSFKGNTTNLSEITVIGKTNLEGNITTTGNQNYGGKLSLEGISGSTVNLTSNAGQLIKMEGGLDAGYLNININNANWHIGSLGAENLSNLNVNAKAKSTLAGNIIGKGEINLQGGAELLNNDRTISASKTTVGKLIDANNLGLTIQGNLAILPSTSINNLKHLEVSGTSVFEGSIQTASYQKFYQQVTLSGSSQLTASELLINQGLIGNNNSLKASGTWKSNGNLSNLASLELIGTSYLNGTITTNTSGQTYSGAIYLTDNTTLLATAQEITLKGDINGSYLLDITANKTNINGNLGNTIALNRLSISGATHVTNNSIITQGDQNYLASFNSTNSTNLLSHAGNINLSQATKVTGNFYLKGNKLSFSDIKASGSLSLYSNTNISYSTGTNLHSGNALTLAINQESNTSGVTLDLNTLTLEGNEINLKGSNYDHLISFKNSKNKWVLNSQYQGTLENSLLKSNSNTASFKGFSHLIGGNSGDTYNITSNYLGKLTLGSGDDTAIFSSTGKLTNPLDGGLGNNTYDISGWGASASLILGEGYTNFNHLIAKGATLEGSKVVETSWSLSGNTSGTVNTTSFSGFSALKSGLGGTNSFKSNGQYIGDITLFNNNTWEYSTGNTLTRGNLLGSGNLSISTPASGKGSNLTIGGNDLILPNLKLHTGTTIIGGSLSLNNLPLTEGNLAKINTNNLTVSQPIKTGGNLVLFGSDITLATPEINADGSASLIAAGDICNGCVDGLSGNGDLTINQETTLKAKSGQIIAARGIVNASDLVLDFNGGDFELAVSAEQKDNSQPSNFSNVRSITLLDTTNGFIKQLGLNLVSVTVNFTNPAAAVMGVRVVEVIDLALFEEDLTLFGRLGEGVALAFEQCEEIEGCTPDVTDEELSTAIEAIEFRIQQLELELETNKDPKRKEQLQDLLIGFRAELQELATYRNDLQEFTGFEEAFANDFGTTNEIDMEALQREVAVIETIYARVRFLESLQFNKKRREDFAQRTGLDLSGDRLSQIIDSTLTAAAMSEARVEKMLDGE